MCIRDRLKSICLLISRGALISMAVILVVLPAALIDVYKRQILDQVLACEGKLWLD